MGQVRFVRMKFVCFEKNGRRELTNNEKEDSIAGDYKRL